MLEHDRLIAAEPEQGEVRIDHAIRPKHLKDYIGQPRVREQLEIFIGAARLREESLDHTLVFGPPGLGKTTLANIIATEMGVGLKSTSGPVLERAGDLAAMLTNLEPGDVLFMALDPVPILAGLPILRRPATVRARLCLPPAGHSPCPPMPGCGHASTHGIPSTSPWCRTTSSSKSAWSKCRSRC